ncbi:MAG: glycosyltransferase family 39 protein, partial [Chloroflexota bacterium]
TVTAVFIIAKKLWNETVALVAAILLTGSHFHIHYSRLGMTNVWDALFALLALGTVAIAWQEPSDTTKTRRVWILGGLFIGLNAYLFTSSRLLPIILLLLLVFALLINRTQFQSQFRNILAAALLALVVALPQMLFYNSNAGIVSERAVQLGIFSDQSGWLADQAIRAGLSETAVLRQQIWQSITAFNGGIDRSPSYRSPESLLSFGAGLFFSLGLIIALFKFGENKFRTVVLWVVTVMLFAGAFLIDLPNSHRLVMAIPAIMILAAVALDTYTQFLLNALPDTMQANFKVYLKPMLIILAVLFIMGDLFFYYGRFRNDIQLGDRNTEIADVMAHYLENQDEPATAYFLGAPSMFSDFPTITFIAQSFRRGINLYDVNIGETAIPAATTDRLLFIILPERATELDGFQVQYPGGTVSSFSGVYGDPLFLVYEVEQ